jgi:hypothetical protein
VKSKEEQAAFDHAWNFFTPKGADKPPCLKCYTEAVTLHEIIPRSQNRSWMQDMHRPIPRHTLPLCANCHKEVQRDTLHWKPKLERMRDDYIYALQSQGSLPIPDKPTRDK